MKMEFFFKLDNIDVVAKKFLNYSSGYKIFTFTGDLGAGKTTFIESVCKALEISERVTSPTYSLVHEYEAKHKKIIYHMDLYRLKSLEEAIDAGIEECLLSGEICMIEWPSKIAEILPEEIVKSEILIINTGQRKLVVELP